jgi:SAM-dependent methyltransferase
MDNSSWNQRYGQPGFAYGTEPNTFLASVADRIPKGRILSLGEGEGRNAVHLASLGYDVTAVDSSDVGLAKARQLAVDRGVALTTITADLADFQIEAENWDGIISIFCHLPTAVRVPLYRRVVSGLKPGGVLVLESYTPKQLLHGTGGPTDVDRLLTLAKLQQELSGLQLVHAFEVERDVQEGKYHAGRSSVVQLIAAKPSR